MRYLLIVAFLIIFSFAHGQTKTTEELHKHNAEAFSLFFYQNTLRMFNQNDDPAYDAIIKDIEKMKFLMIDRTQFAAADYQKLISGFKSESFEEIMSSRVDGRNFDVFLKESKGKTLGMVITVNDPEKLYVLDIVGSIALDQVPKFVSTLDENSQIADKIKSLAPKK